MDNGACLTQCLQTYGFVMAGTTYLLASGYAQGSVVTLYSLSTSGNVAIVQTFSPPVNSLNAFGKSVHKDSLVLMLPQGSISLP